MPTYEYRCPEGHDSEDFVLKISDAKSEIACPTCGQVAARKVSAGSGLLFKGSGFYITDYGKDGKKDQKSDAKPAAATSDSASAPKADAKPTTKPAADKSASSSSSSSK